MNSLAICDSMRETCEDQTRREKRVETMASWIRRASPYGCFLNASIILANTGFDREMRLRDMTQRYMRDVSGELAVIRSRQELIRENLEKLYLDNVETSVGGR